jgi:hypothetical protein
MAACHGMLRRWKPNNGPMPRWRSMALRSRLEMTERARRYVARKIVQAERRGAVNIDPRATEYAGAHLNEMRDAYEKALGKSPRGRGAAG